MTASGPRLPTPSNGQTAWTGSSWPEAAEINKYTHRRDRAGSGRFATMLAHRVPALSVAWETLTHGGSPA